MSPPTDAPPVPWIGDGRPATTSERSDGGVVFTTRGLLAGARGGVPLALSTAVGGAVFGAVARRTGLSPAEATLMSALVNAGSAQLVALELWDEPPPVLALALTTLIVNLRHVLMGATLRPWFAALPPAKAYGPLFWLSDETWALTVAERERGQRDAAFLLGSGLALYAAWVGSTAVGAVAGAAIRDPAAWGLDFAFPAVFASLLVVLYRGRGDVPPWAVAAAVAVAAERLLPGAWYILLGGVVGAVVGGVRGAR